MQPAAAFAAVAEDCLVTARWQEARGAELQEQAREAAAVGDWTRVDGLIAEARIDAGDNAWAQESLAALEQIAARRDSVRFRKEAAYKASRMRERLYDADESLASYDATSERGKALFLRRKLQEGKKMGD